jgi:hypothetical protein
LMKNTLLCRAARAESNRERANGRLWSRLLEGRASGAVGLRWQAVFGSSDYLE